MRSYEKRSFVFTEKELKEKMYNGEKIIYTDSACPCLCCLSLKDGNGAYTIQATINSKLYRKVIGNLYRVSLENARDIVRNILENKEEFSKNNLKRCESLVEDFKKNGFYPRKKPEIKLDEEYLFGEIERLKQENALLNKKLKAIENIVLFNEVDNG